MPAVKIIWKTIKDLGRRWAPIDEPEPADHKPSFVMRDGAPDLCCDKHPFYVREP